MPAYPGTTIRSIRVADATWEAAMAQAGQDETSLTAIIVEFLTNYGQGKITADGKKRAAPPK